MKKIVFITTSLADKGPNQQLLNIIKRLDRKQFKPVLISLTNPIKGDKYNFFKKLEIDIHFLGVKKLTAIFSFIRLKKLLSRLEPQLIHSHGFLSDLIIILTRINIPHILTIRCDPYIDYPTKFGLIPGNIMAFIHIVAIRLCPLAIACSESLQLTFKNYNVNTKVVRNGVDPEFISDDFEVKSSDQKVPIFITAGSLIPRKNVELMISIFCSDELRNKVKFKVLGDGFLMSRCQKLAEDNILILGHIDRPYQHLSTSQFYISLSESEGMPNSVIEALMVGLPCVLSDIGPHREIYNLMPDYIYLVNCSTSSEVIAANINSWLNNSSQFNNHDIRSKAIEIFHADKTASNYQKIYNKIIGVLNV